MNLKRNLSSIFSKRLLAVLLSISFATNLVLATRLSYPDLSNTLRVAFLPKPEIQATDHALGRQDARVTLIEYSDFQCPYCARFHAFMNRLSEEDSELASEVQWIYRHYPLGDSQQLATIAAEASECAAEQGGFWEYADMLFANQKALAYENFPQYAAAIGIEVESFKLCLDSRKYQSMVAGQIDDARRLKIWGTPTVYLNGRRFNGMPSYDSFKSLLETMSR